MQTVRSKVEMLWNGLASTYDFSLLCGYAFGHFYKETGCIPDFRTSAVNILM